MSTISREQLKQNFANGQRPRGSEYAELFDAFLHHTEDGLIINGVNGDNQNLSTLGVVGNLTVGGSWAATHAAPNQGLLVEGSVGLGTEAPQGALDVKGHTYLEYAHIQHSLRTVWVATGNGPYDETDNGRILTRTLAFHKYAPESVLLITYTDNFRVRGNPPAVGRWRILIDQQEAQPSPIFLDWHIHSGSTNQANHHLPGIAKGLAYSIPSGPHEISVWVGGIDHPTGGGDRYTGWLETTWMIEVEEVMIHPAPDPA
ncbi:MAG TPA: hypothetical protein DCR93_37110 [Cytophagales bacterium]|nr:hypothetical protein [Cytophagales bacterium]